MNPASATTVDPVEIEKFSRIALDWWDEDGPFAPLHRLNPVRLGYIRQAIVAHFGLDAVGLKPFAGLSLIDVGCGGGLVAEPLTRLGGTVTGLDADDAAIAVARAHAEASGLAIDYRPVTSEALAAEGARFDVVLALEIVEHVGDIPAFLASLKMLMKPGGLLIMSTLNRTPKSFLSAIVGAEYVLRWLPRGTHHWNKFLKPSELARHLREQGLGVSDVTGLSYNPLNREFSLGQDVSVNYLLTAK